MHLGPGRTNEVAGEPDRFRHTSSNRPSFAPARNSRHSPRLSFTASAGFVELRTSTSAPSPATSTQAPPSHGLPRCHVRSPAGLSPTLPPCRHLLRPAPGVTGTASGWEGWPGHSEESMHIQSLSNHKLIGWGECATSDYSDPAVDAVWASAKALAHTDIKPDRYFSRYRRSRPAWLRRGTHSIRSSYKHKLGH